MGVEVPMLVGVDLIDNHHRLLLLSSRSALMLGQQTSFQTLCVCDAWVDLMEYYMGGSYGILPGWVSWSTAWVGLMEYCLGGSHLSECYWLLQAVWEIIAPNPYDNVSQARVNWTTMHHDGV